MTVASPYDGLSDHLHFQKLPLELSKTTVTTAYWLLLLGCRVSLHEGLTQYNLRKDFFPSEREAVLEKSLVLINSSYVKKGLKKKKEGRAEKREEKQQAPGGQKRGRCSSDPDACPLWGATQIICIH